MRSLFAVFVTAALYCCPAPALAETEVGISLAPLIGSHDEGKGPSRVAPIPIPILEIRQRTGIFEIFVEGLPFSPSIAQSNGTQQLSTSLTFVDGVLRVYADRFYAGVGEMIYNQSTSYLPSGEVDSSRVVGTRYEIGALVGKDRRFRAKFDYMPRLIGEVQGRLGALRLNLPETGTQVEGRVDYVVPHPRSAVRYSLRYVNYIARASTTFALSDHNVGVIPSVTFLWKFGN
jgi:hypothetical protein